MVNFGNVLKELRVKSGMTQKMLAEKLDVTKSVVSYYELQERTPSPEVLIKLSDIFHVSTDYLLGLDTSSKRTVDVSDLPEEDIVLVEQIIDALRKKNKK